MSTTYWIFAPYHFKPSYWLMLKREGFSGDVLTNSQELEMLTFGFNLNHLNDIIRLVQTPPDYWFTGSVRDELDTLILGGRIKVYKVKKHTATQLSDFNDPIYSSHRIFEQTGNPVVDKRNALAVSLGKTIASRWAAKDNADFTHMSQHWFKREGLELYDVGEAVVDVVVDTIVGLWDIVKFVVTIVGESIKLAFSIAMSQAEFYHKLANGDFDAAKEDLRKLGVAVDDAFKSFESFKTKVAEGLKIFTQLKDDPKTRRLIIDYLDSLYQSIEYRKSRTLGVTVVSTIGVEILIALATGGAGNVARRAGQLGAKMAKAGKLVKIGPFPVHAIDEMVDLAKTLSKPAIKAEKKPPIIEIPADKPKPKTNTQPKADKTLDSNDKPEAKPKPKPISSFDEAEERLNKARDDIEKRKAKGLPLYQPKYSDSELAAMASKGATANERFLVSVQPKNTNPDAMLSYQRDSGLVPTWTTSFDQLEAADKDPKLIHQVLGADSNFDPNKEYVMHIIDRGENLDNFGNNTIVPTWDKLADATAHELGDSYDPNIIRQTMNSDYQAEYAGKMGEFWDAGGNEFDENIIKDFSSTLSDREKDLFNARHKVRTEIGANSEFTGNGLTANTANGGGKYGVVETLSLERNLPKLSQLQSDGIVRTLNLSPL